MKIVVLSGSIVGSKTRIAMENVVTLFNKSYPEVEVTFVDLVAYNLVFSDGRPYHEYDGDTKIVLKKIMDADAIVIGTPVFQASISAPLKNIFDLLPANAFMDKVVSIVVTAGTAKHYLMVEQHLKPILAYMKAHIVPTYVFIEEADFLRDEIVNDDISFRLARLVEDTVYTVEAYAMIREKFDEQYGF